MRGERLIPLDEAPRRGEIPLGEIDTPNGPMLHVIHWRRQKRLDHQVKRDFLRDRPFHTARAVNMFFGR